MKESISTDSRHDLIARGVCIRYHGHTLPSPHEVLTIVFLDRNYCLHQRPGLSRTCACRKEEAATCIRSNQFPEILIDRRIMIGSCELNGLHFAASNFDSAINTVSGFNWFCNQLSPSSMYVGARSSGAS